MGRGGKGKSKKSVDWYTIKLIGQLPSEDLLHQPDTGMSKQDIYNFFDKHRGIYYKTELKDDDLVDDANASRKVSKKIIDQILETGIAYFKIKHRPAYKTETARLGYYYKTQKGASWIDLKREYRIKEKEI